MSNKIKFGIIGLGRIARAFAEALREVEEVTLWAVAAREKSRAEEFSKEFGECKAYGSYEELAMDSEIDIVYIATPNGLHKEHANLCMSYGKGVICEKPFATNAKETEEMIRCAKENKVFLMEAMWTRYLPVNKKVKEWVTSGEIGDIKLLQGGFGFKGGNRQDPRYNLALAGGALMDVGIYLVSFASYVLEKQPCRVTATTQLVETGIDESTYSILSYDLEEVAVLSSSMRTEVSQEMVIVGDKGTIKIPNFWGATKAYLYKEGKLVQEYVEDFKVNGYEYEIEEIVNCIRKEKLESSYMPLQETLDIMKTMDNIRKVAGIEFEGESI